MSPDQLRRQRQMMLLRFCQSFTPLSETRIRAENLVPGWRLEYDHPPTHTHYLEIGGDSES